MLSLCELRRAAAACEAELLGARVQEVRALSARNLVLECWVGGSESARGRRVYLFFSCDPKSARISVLPERPRATEQPGALVQYLKAHALDARLAAAKLIGNDRHLSLHLAARGAACELRLLLMGARSNLYLLDAAGRLIASLRPLGETRAELRCGEAWVDPPAAQRPEGEDRFVNVPETQLLAAIEAEYAHAEVDQERAAQSRELERALARRRQHVERALSRISAESEETARAAQYQKWGELLKGVLSSVKPRAREVRAQDYASGTEVAIPLDPALSPQENLAQLFRRARKAEAQKQKAAQRRLELEAELAELRNLEREFGELRGLAAGLAELRDVAAEEVEPRDLETEPVTSTKAPETASAVFATFAARPAVARLLAHTKKQTARRPVKETRSSHADLPVRLRPRRYRSSDGLEIWVGRSAEGNDLLTTRLAHGNDLFFHLEGEAGSHVVLRALGRGDVPQASILDACELAVHFSKHRRAARADVHIAHIKDVHKPKGVARGLVHVARGKTIHLRRDSARLAQVLAARIDES